MSVIERSITYKLEWSSTSVDTKSDEISLHDSKMCCIGVKLNPRTFSHIIYFVCKSKQPSVLEISDVFFSTCSSSENRTQMKLLSHEGPHQVFSFDVLEWKTPLTLTCWVTLKEKVEGFSYQLMDGLLTDQLLASTENERLTDVKFIVGLSSKKKIFAAHRSILAARSPVLAELFEKEDVTLPIEIIDAQPSVFQDFLHFIYTGKFKGCSASSLIELQALADRFQIKNLQKICRQPIQEMNVSELTSLVMSLSQPASRVDNNNNTGLFGKSFAPTHISPLFTGASFNASAAAFPSTNSVLAQTQSLLASRNPLFSNIQTATPTSSNTGFNFFSVSKPDTPASFNFTGSSSASTAFENSSAFSFVKVEGAGALLNSLRRPSNISTASAVNAPILIASTIGTNSVFNSGPILSTSAVSSQTTTSVSSAHVNSTSLHGNFCASTPITTSVSYTRASIHLTDKSSTLPGPSGMNNVLCNEAASAATYQPLTQNK